MKSKSIILLATALSLVALPAAADDVVDFYKGKTITITSAGGAGGGYGVYALLLSEYIGKYIPGQPNVIVNFMPGAGGVKAANYEYNVSPKDGTSILAPLQSMATLQLLGKKGVRFDAAKFEWVGRAAETTSGFVVHRNVATSLAQLEARRKPTVVGITQPGAPNHILPALLKYCTGMNLKLVSGYKGSGAIALAFKRGEVDGVALPLDSIRLVYPTLLKQTMIAQSGLERAKAFPNVPLVLDLCKGAAKKKVAELFQVQEEMGRSYALPPGTPAARVAALRHAFDEAMKDKDLLASAAQRKLQINPLPGARVQKMVENHIATASAAVAVAKRAVGIK